MHQRFLACQSCYKRQIRIEVSEKKEQLTLITGNELVEPKMNIDLSYTINQEREIRIIGASISLEVRILNDFA